MGPYVAVAVLTAALIAANALWPTRRKRIDRAIAARPRALVHTARGAVRLTGRVRRISELVTSPLSGRPCVAFDLTVDEPRPTNGPGGAGWHRRVKMSAARTFAIVDESGEARIDLSGPFEMSLGGGLTGTTEGKHPGRHPQLASFLSSLDVSSTGWFGRWRQFHYVEAVLEEGELISVSGESTLEVDPTGERTDPRSPPQCLVLRGTEETPLLISDAREVQRLDA